MGGRSTRLTVAAVVSLGVHALLLLAILSASPPAPEPAPPVVVAIWGGAPPPPPQGGQAAAQSPAETSSRQQAEQGRKPSRTLTRAPAAAPPGPGVPEGEQGGVLGGVVGGVLGGELGATGTGAPGRRQQAVVIKCVREPDGALEDCRIIRSVPHLDELVLDGVRRLRVGPPPQGVERRTDFVVPLRLILPKRFAWRAGP
jgi:periplasmic protein TonB